MARAAPCTQGQGDTTWEWPPHSYPADEELGHGSSQLCCIITLSGEAERTSFCLHKGLVTVTIIRTFFLPKGASSLNKTFKYKTHTPLDLPQSQQGLRLPESWTGANPALANTSKTQDLPL